MMFELFLLSVFIGLIIGLVLTDEARKENIAAAVFCYFAFVGIGSLVEDAYDTYQEYQITVEQKE